MQFFKPTPYVQYLPPQLTRGKVWYIHYSVQDPVTGKMKRFRIKLNRIQNKTERLKAAKAIMAALAEKLALGWNPIYERAAPKAYTSLYDAIEAFLKIKEKEMENNSMRSYRSFVRTFKKWLVAHKIGEDIYACSFTKPLAMEFVNDIEADDNISPRTYNNYIAFYRSMFSWFVDKGYVMENVFETFKKKPKRLTKKSRRMLTDEELETLFRYLEKENKEYLVICLLCYCCLIRPKEIVMLKCQDIDLDKQVVHIRAAIAKNDNDSSRTIPDEMLTYLKNLTFSSPDDYLFSDKGHYDFSSGKKKLCSRKLAKYWSDVIRPACKFPMEVQLYSLKYSGITNMIGSGVPISFVKQQADHSSLAMTSIYLGKSPNATEELKKIHIIK